MIRFLAALLLLPGLASSAPDADPGKRLAQVQEAFEARFQGMPVAEVRDTPMPGIYEVRIGSELVYVDARVDYVLQGRLIDARSRQDLTEQRLQALSQVPFDSLPLELAVRQVKGDGSRVMAVFEDPNCGYCKRLHTSLQAVDNVTVYSFLYPILSPDSHDKARDVWCAPEPAVSWARWMHDGQVPAEAHCDDNPVDEVLALGQRLLVRGTPAIFFTDGTRANGALPAAELNRRLAAAAQN